MGKGKYFLIILFTVLQWQKSFADDVFRGMHIDNSLDAKSKVYLVKDLLHKTQALFSNLDSTNHPIISSIYDLYIDSLSAKSVLNLYPSIHKGLAEDYKNEAFVTELNAITGEKEIRNFIVNHFEIGQALKFNQAIQLRLIKSHASSVEVDMMDPMYKQGKLYVVIGVILTIFTVLILTLIRLEKKINQLSH